jgi:hypothetical protein
LHTSRKRELLKNEPGLPEFIDGVYAEAESYADKSLKSLRGNEIKSAKAFFYAANAYYGWAERDLKNTRELGEKLAGILGTKRG